MIETITPLTPVIQLESRKGRVGSIQAYDSWDFCTSLDTVKESVATIAALSYGRDAAQNPTGLFNKIMRDQHLAVTDHIPVLDPFAKNLPMGSLRHNLWLLNTPEYWTPERAQEGRELCPCHSFLVEAPITVMRQWVRHRAFAYLELSRRYTPPGRMGFEFYGQWHPDEAYREHMLAYIDAMLDEYEWRLAQGEPLELAREALGLGLMTKFWVSGYDMNWLVRDDIIHADGFIERVPGFVGLRSDAHAQAEIRVFSDWVKAALPALPADLM